MYGFEPKQRKPSLKAKAFLKTENRKTNIEAESRSNRTPNTQTPLPNLIS
jgi:hypothetical protein